MTFLITNGQQYSDHKLYFVEADQQSDIEALLALPACGISGTVTPEDEESHYAYGCRIIGTSQRLTWLAPEVSVGKKYETLSLQQFKERAEEGYL